MKQNIKVRRKIDGAIGILIGRRVPIRVAENRRSAYFVYNDALSARELGFPKFLSDDFHDVEIYFGELRVMISYNTFVKDYERV